MKKFNEVLKIIYRDINKKRSSSIPHFECGMIYEDCAFHKLPRLFTDKLISIIILMKNNKILEQEIDLRTLFKLIKKNEVENFQEFFNFIQLLINSTTEKILTIRMNIENSYTEPIELIELCDENYSKVFYEGKQKELLIKKIKNKSLSNALQIMKSNLNNFTNLGLLSINPKTITNDMYIYDSNDTVIGHEIRHFIIFLQRWSKMNYLICKHYSNLITNNNDFKQYSLHEDEFITLSSTVILRLINIFLKNRRSLKIQDINLLIKSVLVKTNEYLINELNNDLYWYDLLDLKDEHIKTIISFYRNILNDRKINIKNDKFKTLIKWTFNSFIEKIEEIKLKRKK